MVDCYNLAYVILPGLSREGCTLVVLELTQHSRQVTSLLCLNDRIMSCSTQPIQGLSGSLFLNIKCGILW